MPRMTIAMLLPVAILTLFASLLAGCTGQGSSTARPILPSTFHFLEPGTTNVVIVPVNCNYAIWTVDDGLLYLQGLVPKKAVKK